MKKDIKNPLFATLLLALSMAASQGATVNVGVVANSSTTGQFLSVAGTTTTTGLIKVGFFSGKSFADIQTVINGWQTNTPSTTYDAYKAINDLFTQVGTTINPSSSGGTLGGTTSGLYSTAGSGWNFSSAGNVSGTANYVDLSLAPQGTQIYVWAFNGSTFTSSGFNSTQWALVTDRDATGGTWVLPGSGGLSAVLNTITSNSDVLLGSDNGANVNMVAIIPEPMTSHLIGLGFIGALALRRKFRSALKV